MFEACCFMAALLVAHPAPDGGVAGPARKPSDLTFHGETVVTATRSDEATDRLPVEVLVLDARKIESVGARTLDDILRQVPSFQLSREQSSEVAIAPSTSVAFRGLGGTSSSRALVLLDGFPINDPFQGYVRWSQVPPGAVERVEIVRGGSVVWGNLGIGGTINLITRSPRVTSNRVSARVGERSLRSAVASASRGFGESGVRVSASYRKANGYYRIGPEDRGPADVSIASETGTAHVSSDLRIGPSSRIEVNAGWFNDNRGVLLRGDQYHTRNEWFHFGGRFVSDPDTTWAYHVFATQLDSSSSENRAAAGRTVAIPVRDQYAVPARSYGADAQWSRRVGRHDLVLGADGVRTRGEVDERSRYVEDAFTAQTASGGRQWLAGAYLQDLFAASERWTVTGALRWDHWNTSQVFQRVTDLVSSAVTTHEFGARAGSVLSPSLGATVRVGNRALARAAVYGGFRAPSLNELTKPVNGPTRVIEPNPGLAPERLRGGEVGWELQPRRSVDLSVNLFHEEVDRTIQSVTTGQTGTVFETIEPCGYLPPRYTCQQRENVGQIRSQGVEVGGHWSSDRGYGLDASAVVQSAKVTRAPERPTLVGKRVMQAPDWVLVTAIRFPIAGRGSGSLGYRWVSDRYDDDLNQRYVGQLRAVSLALRYRFTPVLEGSLTATNLLDRANPVAVPGGLTEFGAPRLVSIGLRWTPVR